MPRLGSTRICRVVFGLLVSGAMLSGATPMAALARASTVYTVGVDNAGPSGHVFEYVDFFPRDSIKVAVGDVIDFNWNPNSLDGAHTVSFLPKGTSSPPIGTPEPSSDEPGVQLNPQILFPSDPTCGSSSSNPCTFDGTRAVSSGFIINSMPTPPYMSDFYVKLDSKLLEGGSSVDVRYICELHPGQVGTVTLVADASNATDPSTVQQMAASQLSDDTKGALNAAKADRSPYVVHNMDGTSNVTIIAGTATPYVEVDEMLPTTLSIHPGDTVTWLTKTVKNPHTVTFPRGHASDSVDPLQPSCEAKPNDTPPSTFGPPCPNPMDFEIHLLPPPLGAKTTISTPDTVGTSGIIGATDSGFPNTYSYTFPNAGAFDYMCRIHDHMVGLIQVH